MFLSVIRRMCYSYLAFIDNSSRGPSKKKRLSQVDNQDEPYVDVKVCLSFVNH